MFNNRILSRRILHCSFQLCKYLGISTRQIATRYEENPSTLYGWINDQVIPPIEISVQFLESIVTDYFAGEGKANK